MDTLLFRPEVLDGADGPGKQMPRVLQKMSLALGNGFGNTRWTEVSYGTGLMSSALSLDRACAMS